MRKTFITIISLIISLLVINISMFYSSSTLSKTHHRKHHRIHHSRIHHHHASKHSSTHVAQSQVNTNSNRQVNPKVWNLALKAYKRALQKGYVKQHILTIIDYSLPSSAKRLWVVDVERGRVLYNTLVAHGKHTGGLFAKNFSDRPGSLASSLGLFVTENTYMGSKGYSLRLRGLEPGFNDQARSRAIVMHGAWYATSEFAHSHGRLGLSWGCPAVSPAEVKPIINQIKGGTALFAYYPNSKWLQRSKFLS